MSRFFSEKYSTLEVYIPGEQPQDMQYVKLNTNESPYPPSPKVIAAVNEAELYDLKLYPDPECKKLRGKIAELYEVLPENIFISNGSDEILNFYFMAFCDNSHPVVFPDITYGFYKVFVGLYSLPYKEIPLKSYKIDSLDYIGIGKNIVIANPNAPTGIFLPVSEIEKILKSNQDNVVLIDEAYIDFGGESCYKLINKYDNLLVAQTYSKSRSMAGARLGFAFGSKALIDDLNKIKYSTNPYNINRLTLAAGAAAIDDNSYYMDNCRKIIQTRDYTVKALKEMGFTVTDSSANFIFAKSPLIGGLELYEKLKKYGVLVRHFGQSAISDYNRITIGTKEQMDILLDKIRGITKEKEG